MPPSVEISHPRAVFLASSNGLFPEVTDDRRPRDSRFSLLDEHFKDSTSLLSMHGVFNSRRKDS